MDLTDPDERAAWCGYLGAVFTERPVICGPGVLAGYAKAVAMLAEAGSRRPLIVATHRGAGPVPAADEAEVVFLEPAAYPSATEELRAHERLVRNLPAAVVERIDRYDPDGEAVWFTSPFVVDEPVLGRRVYGGRPAAWLALEDKLAAEEIWAETGIARAPSRIVEVDLAALAAAGTAVDSGAGVVWSGDARDGFNGGADFVRWVVTDAERAAALAFFAVRCDRARVLPFLEGVPCSIHGMVLPDGTATFRPVEIAMARDGHRFVYGGLSSFWDPAEEDREEMRDVARRTGEALRRRVGYRGAFGVDGVLTADGFRPTELNTRMSAGLTTLAAGIDPRMFTLLQTNLVAGREARVTVPELEALVPLMDAQRNARPTALAHRHIVDGDDGYPVAWDRDRLVRTATDTGSRLIISETPIGAFAMVEPCTLLSPGDRLAEVNIALMRYLDEEYDAGFGPLTAAPDVRAAALAGGEQPIAG